MKRAAAERDPMLDALAPIIATRIAARDTMYPVFHGCIDWHSAVHGHWALLRIVRATGRHEERAEAALKSLGVEGLAREAALLRSDTDFEMPYGRAWFLLLTEEFQRYAIEKKLAHPGRLRAMAAEVADSLEHYLDGHGASANVGEYRNPCWALLRLHGWYRFTENEAGLSRINGRLSQMQAIPLTFGADLRSGEFFSRPGNYVTLLAAAQPQELARLLKSNPIADEDLQPLIALPRGPHALGMNWSRAWALKALASAVPAAERPRYEAAYAAHVAQAWKHHQQKVGNVWAYDHWVPQFAVYALTEP